MLPGVLGCGQWGSRSEDAAMWFKREEQAPEVDEVIDLTERLSPYDGEAADTVNEWRNALKADDRERYKTFKGTHRRTRLTSAATRARR